MLARRLFLLSVILQQATIQAESEPLIRCEKSDIISLDTKKAIMTCPKGMVCGKEMFCQRPIQCGGIQGLQCPDGLTCEDNPLDSCDPKNGGSDCIGICVEKPKCLSDPRRSYVSKDLRECAKLGSHRNLLSCRIGFAGFVDQCGCGCERVCPKDPKFSYVSKDPEQCKLMKFSCGDDSWPFSNDCGCGCWRIPSQCPHPKESNYLSMDPSRCRIGVSTCGGDLVKFDNQECGCGCTTKSNLPEPTQPTPTEPTKAPTRHKSCPLERKGAMYAGTYPSCAFSLFRCPAGTERFNLDGCGCGCRPTNQPTKYPIIRKTRKPTKKLNMLKKKCPRRVKVNSSCRRYKRGLKCKYNRFVCKWTKAVTYLKNCSCRGGRWRCTIAKNICVKPKYQKDLDDWWYDDDDEEEEDDGRRSLAYLRAGM